MKLTATSQLCLSLGQRLSRIGDGSLALLRDKTYKRDHVKPQSAELSAMNRLTGLNQLDRMGFMK